MKDKRDWLNCGHGYVQYTWEISEKELLLLKLYGAFFDDEWAYWQPPKNKGILKRRPIWMKQKNIPMEKHRAKDPKQITFPLSFHS